MDALATTSIGVGGIIHQFDQRYRQHFKMSPVQQKAFFAIKNCRTSMMGGHTDPELTFSGEVNQFKLLKSSKT
jgi:hypothetical protein